MKRKAKYFKIGDLVIYSFLLFFFVTLGMNITKLSQEKASKVEIYVDGQLQYVYPLQEMCIRDSSYTVRINIIIFSREIYIFTMSQMPTMIQFHS